MQYKFTNEHGNRIYMTVGTTDAGVEVCAHGPESDVEHTWTQQEAEVLYELLGLALGKR